MPRSKLNRLREHLPFLVIAPILIVVMTWPTALQVFDTSSFWTPALDRDAWLKVWDAWHLKRVLAGEAQFHHTDMLFYPQGVSLAYLPYSLPHMIVMNALQLVMGASNAYCLAYLLIVFACALSGYIYCSYLFRDKWLGLLGGVIFGCSQHVIGKTSNPDLNFIATLPLMLYFLHRGIREGRAGLLAGAGVMLGLTAYCGMYIFVCAGLLAGLFILLFAKSRFRERQFWAGLLALCSLAVLVSAGRVMPMLADASDLDSAIQRKPSWEAGNDLLDYFVNYRHPVLSPVFFSVFDIEPVEISWRSDEVTHGDSYIGYATLLLIGMGLLRKSSRKAMLPWLVIAAVFLVLRLGSHLRIDETDFTHIRLPKHYLSEWLPTAFAPFYLTSIFHAGALLPLAALACAGLGSAFESISHKRRAPVVLALVAIFAFESYYRPFAIGMSHDVFAFADWLARQGDGNSSVALVNLPLIKDNQPISMTDMLYQTVHGYPIASGIVSRIPEDTYSYMDSNAMLASGGSGRGIICSRSRRDEMSAALGQLQSDGYAYVALLRRPPAAAPFLASFADIPPVFADRHALIYEMSQLREHCDDPPPGSDSLGLHMELVYGSVISPRDEAVITFHPAERLNEDALRYLSWNADFGQNLNHVTVDGSGQFSLQSTDPAMRSIEDVLAQDTLLLLRAPDAVAVRGGKWMSALLDRFKLCQRLAETDHIAIDHYLRKDMPCELVTAAEKLQLQYDNGSQLRNRFVELKGRQLWLRLWWRIARFPKTSYSIQVFDSAGDRVSQTDSVMNRTMKSHTLDLSDLPAGEYQARLIVYDFETGVSHGGERMSDGSRFSRDIEIARIALDA